MESVYFYEEKISKDVAKMLKDDEFMRISYVIRDSKILSERKGYTIYIQANSDEMSSIEEKLKDLGAEKITGTEEKTIIDAIKAEEENTATGIGMIFG